MHFGRPDNLYFLLLLVPMAVAFGGFLWWKRRVSARIGHFQLVTQMTSTHSPRRQLARALLVMLAFALICIACARPQWGSNERTIKKFGVDVVFALDLSKSMLAQDIPPSRLEAAKMEILATLKALQGDRVGLVVFTAVSFAQSPLTADYGAIDFYLDKLTPNQMPVGGTSLAPAMLDSIKLLTGEEVHIGPARAHQQNDDAAQSEYIKRAKNQVIVLITDGEDHESAPLRAAQVAREHGIHVVTVGIGSPDGSRIPVYDAHGNLSGYKRNQRGELVQTTLDSKTLQKIAGATNGTYVRYAGKNSVVNGVTQFINHLEKSELESLLHEQYEDRFLVFLTPAFLLLLLAIFLGERRLRAPQNYAPSSPDASKKSARKKSRGSATLLILLILLVHSAALTGCDDTFRNTLGTVDEANELIGQKDYAKALEKYQEAETEVPATPPLHYDLGIGLLGEEKFDEARQAFARALATEDPELRFDSLFNMGLTFARQEKWKEAFDTYKQALQVALDPAKEVNSERIQQGRHNLEVAFRKLFPPCEALEDDSEANDDPASAATLDKLEKTERALCGLNDDWYVLPIIPGSKVSVSATFSQLRDEPDPEHIFLTRPEDLQLSVFDAAGDKALGVDQGSHEDFDPARTRATRAITDLRVTPEMLPGDTNQLLIKLAAGEYREFKYDLKVTAIPPCHALEDDFEPNDSAQAAAAIETGSHELHSCPGNDDWFRVDMELGDSLFVDLQAGEDIEREKPANLKVEILRADTGKVVATNRVEPPFMTAGVQDIAHPGTYLIHISGQTEDEQGPYRADVYHYAPCVIGNDRFEPNDSAQAASDIDPSAEHLRYLRLCAEDHDYFKLPAPEPADDAPNAGANASAPTPAPNAPPNAAGPQTGAKEDQIAWALRRVDNGSNRATSSDESTPLTLDLLSLSGNQVIATGVAPEAPAALGPLNPDAPEVALMPDQVVHHDNADKAQLLLRAQGPATFYHLQQLNPQNPPQEDPQDQQDEQDQNEDADESQDPEQEQDSDENQDENEPSDEGEEDEAKPEDAEPSDEEKQTDADEAQTPEERHMDDILRALEESDDNFQMKKALDNMPRRHIEKDW